MKIIYYLASIRILNTLNCGAGTVQLFLELLLNLEVMSFLLHEVNLLFINLISILFVINFCFGFAALNFVHFLNFLAVTCVITTVVGAATIRSKRHASTLLHVELVILLAMADLLCFLVSDYFFYAEGGVASLGTYSHSKISIKIKM